MLFRLPPEARVRGRVIGTDGRPWAGAVVIASPQPETLRPAVSYAAALTEADGTYVLRNQPAGTGIVLLLGDDAARAAGFPPRIQASQLAQGAEAQVDFLLAAEAPAAGRPSDGAGCLLRGRLLDADGAPLAQHMVSLVREGAGDDEAESSWRGALSGDDGRFEHAGLAPGRWDVFVGDSTGTGTSFAGVVDVPAAAEHGHELRLPRASLAGRAVRADGGGPVPRALALLMRHDPATGARVFHGRQLADPSGRFRFAHLPAGRYELTLHDIDGQLAQAVRDGLELGAEGSLELPDLALDAAGGVVVRVRDARGAPVGGALVRFTGADGATRQFSQVPRTGPDGVHRATGMPPGLWYVAVTPPSPGLRGREIPVDVRAGAPAELEVELADAP
jgi:hypothetical protein